MIQNPHHFSQNDAKSASFLVIFKSIEKLDLFHSLVFYLILWTGNIFSMPQQVFKLLLRNCPNDAKSASFSEKWCRLCIIFWHFQINRKTWFVPYIIHSFVFYLILWRFKMFSTTGQVFKLLLKQFFIDAKSASFYDIFKSTVKKGFCCNLIKYMHFIWYYEGSKCFQPQAKFLNCLMQNLH